eukprot:c29751_g1_i1 orf=325-801(+)
MAERKQKTVLVAIDESQHGKHALQWALDNLFTGLDQNQCDKVILLHSKLSPMKIIGPEQITPDMIIMMERTQERQIASLMNEGKQMCEGKNVTVETLVVHGDAREVICATVEKLKVDLLVIGSHGYGTIKRLLLGSVSDYCIHHAHCPVVVVKKPHQT